MASTIKVDNVQNQPGTNIINKCSVTTTIGAGAGETIKACAATVTLGRCGGTVALASGATQTGFGRTGTVDWITTPKVTGDSPITGVTGKGYFLNTTAGAITINLPAGVAGSIVSVADYAATWQTNSVTVAPNGTDKIGGLNISTNLNTEGQSVTLVYVDSTQGWLNTMDSTSNVRGTEFVDATVSGVCNTLTTAPCCANVKVAKFLGPGTFTVNAVGMCAANNLVSYMVVAGGAGGASTQGSWGGGGGGAGGYREVVSPTSPYTASPLDGYPNAPNRITVTATAYPITVGGGGAGGPGCGTGGTGAGGPGNNSVFDSITSTGGGGGGPGHTPSCRPGCVAKGAPGGSGGGATGAYYAGSPGPDSPVSTGNDPSTTPAQGNNGGSARKHPPFRDSGGGGGAGAVGGNNDGGPGGNGVSTEITGSAVYYAGGAGGGGVPPGTVGCGSPAGGGGGNGATPGRAATAGAVNTGGGGGGGACAPTHIGAVGGSGIVIIRYKFQ